MISLSKTLEGILKASMRILKVEQFGVKTAAECAPFGDDSHPLNDMTAIFANTSERGEPVILGYINKNQLSEIGEKRIYSLKSDGSLSIDIHLKNDGTMEVGGKSDNLVRYSPLKFGIETKDELINAELLKIQTAITALGGSYVKSDVSTNITSAKIAEIKTL